jgi:CBS domain-containing protein
VYLEAQGQARTKEATMLIKEIMTKAPACCTPETTLREIAREMLTHDCGEIPICDGTRLAGVVTDRDIVCRAFTKPDNPAELTARDVMTTRIATLDENESIQRAVTVMVEQKVRRLPVLRNGALVGMLSQADLAEHLPLAEIGALVRKLSVSSKHLAVLT